MRSFFLCVEIENVVCFLLDVVIVKNMMKSWFCPHFYNFDFLLVTIEDRVLRVEELKDFIG